MSLSSNGGTLVLNVERQSGTAEFEYSPTDGLYFWDLSNIKPPTADNGTPSLLVYNLYQGAVFNNDLNRVELTPAQYAALNTSSELFTVYVRSQYGSSLGMMWMYAATPVLHTVEYTDGTGEEAAFPNQVYANLPQEAATPQFSGTPTRDGYTFESWSPSVAPTVTQSVTYTAQWEQLPETYTVEYTNGVGNAAVFPDQVTSDLAAGTATPAFVGTPARDGFTFTGWNPAVAPTVTENITYTARWEPLVVAEETYTVEYTDGVGNSEVFADQVYADISVGEPTPAFQGAPTRAGHTFEGWNPVVADTVTENVTYTAMWAPEIELFTVEYTDRLNERAAFTDQVYTDLAAGTATPVFQGTPTRDGYTFAGWYPVVAATVTENITYTAQWELLPPGPDTYIVSYTDGTGTTTVFPDQVFADLPAGTATPDYVGSIPPRLGFTFTGWFPSIAATVTQNVTYTAQWEPDGLAPATYTVSYTDGTGTTAAFPPQVYTDRAAGTATPAFEGVPTREGYTFTGWNPSIAATVTQNVNYTAQWELVPATGVTKPGLAATGSQGGTELILLLAVAGAFAGILAITARTRRTGSRG